MSISDINDHDAVLGKAYNSSGSEQFSFIYHDGVLTKIPGLARGAGTDVHGLNNAGQAVGLGVLANGGVRPMLYADG